MWTLFTAPFTRIRGEKSMSRKIVMAIALGAFTLGVVLGPAWATGTGAQKSVSKNGSA